MIRIIKQRIRSDREEGFTLIELMVVVLIMAILLAIAIPIFLGARNSANARAAQSNLNTSLTAEQTYYSNNQAYASSGTSSATSPMDKVEPSLVWDLASTTAVAKSDGSNAVLAVGTSSNVILTALGADGNCYSIAFLQAANSSAPAGTYYGAFQSTSNSCTGPSLPSSAGPTQGNAGSHIGSTLATWYTAW